MYVYKVKLQCSSSSAKKIEEVLKFENVFKITSGTCLKIYDVESRKSQSIKASLFIFDF
jgi:hypothetical protein